MAPLLQPARTCDRESLLWRINGKPLWAVAVAIAVLTLFVPLRCTAQQNSQQKSPASDASSGEPAPNSGENTQSVNDASSAKAPNLLASGPLVASKDLKLMRDGKVIDTIQTGDLLTPLELRDKTLVIQTFRGHKGVVSQDQITVLAKSVPVYDKLITIHADDGRLYTLRAGAHWAAGSADKALADFDQAIELGYAEPHAFSSRGLFHAASGNYDLAIADYTTAIEKDPNDTVPIANRASAYMAKGEYEQAIKDYAAAIAKTPTAPLYAQRALAHKLLGQAEEAIADYGRSIELFPEDASALMGRGYLQFQLGRHEAAIEDFSRLLELTPGSAVAYNNRGFNYQQLKQYERALDDFRRAVELAPKYMLALQNKAWLLATCEKEELRDPAAAIAAAEQVCEMSEYKEIGDLVLLAAAHASASSFETAIGWQEKAIEQAPEPLQPNLKKILALYQSGEPLDVKLLEVEPPPADSSDTPTEPSPTATP